MQTHRSKHRQSRYAKENEVFLSRGQSVLSTVNYDFKMCHKVPVFCSTGSIRDNDGKHNDMVMETLQDENWKVRNNNF